MQQGRERELRASADEARDRELAQRIREAMASDDHRAVGGAITELFATYWNLVEARLYYGGARWHDRWGVPHVTRGLKKTCREAGLDAGQEVQDWLQVYFEELEKEITEKDALGRIDSASSRLNSLRQLCHQKLGFVGAEADRKTASRGREQAAGTAEETASPDGADATSSANANAVSGVDPTHPGGASWLPFRRRRRRPRTPSDPTFQEVSWNELRSRAINSRLSPENEFIWEERVLGGCPSKTLAPRMAERFPDHSWTADAIDQRVSRTIMPLARDTLAKFNEDLPHV